MNIQNSSKPFVSIIIPFYNAKDLLALPVKSLMSQSYSNFEVILVDDGSTDNSYQLAKDITKEDHRFNVLQQKNAGPGAARNTGISAANGDYIGFIDSDDYFHESFIHLMSKKAVEEAADVVICETVKVDIHGNIIKEYPVSFRKSISKMEAFSDIMQSLSITSLTQNKIFRKELFENVRFPENIRVNEDVATVYRLILNAEKISFVNEPLFYYVQHKGSSMNSFNPSKIDDRFEVANIIRRYFSENNLNRYEDLYNIYYLQNVVLSSAMQIVIHSDNSTKQLKFLEEKLDHEIYNLSNILKLRKHHFKKMLALLLFKYCKPAFSYLAQREKSKNF